MTHKYTVYYDDGRVFEHCHITDAPKLGVICVVDYHDEPHIHEKSDYYVLNFREAGWTGVDIFGLWDYLIQPGWKFVLFGRTVDNEIFQRIRRAAYEELTG